MWSFWIEWYKWLSPNSASDESHFLCLTHQEIEAGVPGQPRLHGESISQKHNFFKFKNKQLVMELFQPMPFAGLNTSSEPRPAPTSRPIASPTNARSGPRSTPKPSYVPQTSEVTPEVTLGARLLGGEIACIELLLVVYAHSPAHQGSTSVSPARAVAMEPRHLWAAFRAKRFPARFSYFPERLPPPSPLAGGKPTTGQSKACVVVKLMLAFVFL